MTVYFSAIFFLSVPIALVINFSAFLILSFFSRIHTPYFEKNFLPSFLSVLSALVVKNLSYVS